jgi:TRAP-type C4-dicarboxylate transport system substrate-binding protein
LHFSSAHTPKSAIHYAVWVRFANELKKRTDGRVTVTIYHSNSLLSTREAYDGIISGVADMAYVIPDHTPGRFPLFEVTSLPFMVPSSEVGTRLGDALLENIPEMMAEFKAVHMLWTWKTEAFGLSLTEKAGPVRTLEDIKGKKIGGGAMTIALLKALGAAPLSVGISDRYLSAQTGVIDGLLMGWAGLTGWSLYEVTKYHTDANLLAGGAVMVMNKDFWNSLPSDIQKIITDLGAEVQQWQVAAVTEEDKNAEKIITDAGGEFIRLDPAETNRWVAKIRRVWHRWALDIIDKGLPGGKVLAEAIRLLETYK